MKEFSDKSFIDKNAEALRTATSKGASDFDMLCVILGFLFDFNFLHIYETEDGVSFHKINELKKSPLIVDQQDEDFVQLMESAFRENKAASIQKEEQLKDDMLLVNAIAAIPFAINNGRKILIICKQLVTSKNEVIEGYIFDGYELQRYLSVITIFVRIHEQERQLIQNRLLQSEKLAELGTLTAGIAHEINNSLNTIITKLKMLQEYVSDFKQFLIEFKDDNRLLLSQTKRLKADFIIEHLEKNIRLPLKMAERIRANVLSLKRFAAIDTGEMEHINVNQLLEEALEIVWNKVKHKAVVTKNYDQNLKLIKTSPNRLSQVLVNILDNAADAIPEHGNIQINTWQDEKETFIQIIDDGIGISNEHLKKLFTPYFTTKEDGSGIGLYLNHLIISGLRGAIAVKSELGKGATFIIRLPLLYESDHEKA